MTEIVKRRKRPEVCETMIWDGTAAGAMAIVNWMHDNGVNEGVGWTVDHFHREGSYFTVPTLEGRLNASPGALIVKGVDNEFWPVADGIWQRTYE